MSKPPLRRAPRRGSGSSVLSLSVGSGRRCGQSCGISSMTWAPSSRWSSSAPSRPGSRRRGRRGAASASAAAGVGRRRVAAGRPGLLDRLAGGRRGGRRVGARLGAARRRRRRGAARRRPSRAASAAPAVGGRRRLGGAAGAAAPLGRRRGASGWAPGSTIVSTRQSCADHVDRGLAHDLGAAAAVEGVAGAGVGEAEGQRRCRRRRPPGRSG